MVGAGKAEGAMDAGNMLKPALARGELHCVGATTLDEYRQYIEKDAALERRFQKILVDEPSEEDTVAILRGLKERYEVHHGVEITDSAIVAAAKLSQRYITDRQLPDKAIDLIDEAGSRIRMEIDSKPEEMDRLERRLIQLKIEREALKKDKDQASRKRLKKIEDDIATLGKEYADLEEIWKAEKASMQGATHIKAELEQAKVDLEAAHREGNLEKMAQIQYSIIPELEKQLATASDEEQVEMRCCAIKSPKKRLPKWYQNGPAYQSQKCSKANAINYCEWKTHCTACDGSERSRSRSLQCRAPLPRRISRPQPTQWLIPVSRAHRCR